MENYADDAFQIIIIVLNVEEAYDEYLNFFVHAFGLSTATLATPLLGPHGHFNITF